jgi:hypothetical protein
VHAGYLMRRAPCAVGYPTGKRIQSMHKPTKCYTLTCMHRVWKILAISKVFVVLFSAFGKILGLYPKTDGEFFLISTVRYISCIIEKINERHKQKGYIFTEYWFVRDEARTEI